MRKKALYRSHLGGAERRESGEEQRGAEKQSREKFVEFRKEYITFRSTRICAVSLTVSLCVRRLGSMQLKLGMGSSFRARLNQGDV